ncbi:hypothetical protein [Bacteroides pyogenes]|uniref:hypothetical protein n=1 Tax=Bacteroides pyogenes TaxID=310300 RepID=UPI0005583D8B|nr:hypothetical protein [Bacteroides pyogenes]MBB3894939.1 hypothetical protein [Bacteroides pyogenes]
MSSPHGLQPKLWQTQTPQHTMAHTATGVSTGTGGKIQTPQHTMAHTATGVSTGTAGKLQTLQHTMAYTATGVSTGIAGKLQTLQHTITRTPTGVSTGTGGKIQRRSQCLFPGIETFFLSHKANEKTDGGLSQRHGSTVETENGCLSSAPLS